MLDITLCEGDDICNLGGNVILRLFKIDSVNTAAKERADAGMVGEISGVLRLCPPSQESFDLPFIVLELLYQDVVCIP